MNATPLTPELYMDLFNRHQALQATVEALQAEVDTLTQQEEAWSEQVEALQRERDALKTEVYDQKKLAEKYWKEAREADNKRVASEAALDAERELSAAWAEKARQYELELDGDPQNFHGQGRTIGVREQLSQLQALVRALPVYAADALITVDGDLDEIDRLALRSAVMELLEYRATLDATSKAGGNK